ncbi:MAG: hydroxyacid dehydrogenase [Acidobacteria bacterium]|nr:hydroxyacid dehydrogenase [Acidobacteriota bacterium]
MNESERVILLDPHPRTIDLIFSPEDRARLERLGRVVWHDGSPAADEHVERYLPETVAVIGQTALPRGRLDRMALSSARRMHEADAAVRRGDESLYGEADNQDSFLLRGKTLGLLGCGNLGRALLPLLRAFSHDVIAHDPWLHPSVLREMGVEPVGFDELFARSRVLFVLAAVTTENQGAIGARQFDAMPAGSVFVLVSRAGVVDFDAMLDAAEGGRVRVAVDVFPDEPIPSDARARRTPNTLLSAHRAGNIPEIWHGMGRMVVDDLELVLQGLPPQRCTRATPETAARLRSKPIS